MEIYEPAEDSYLLSISVKEYLTNLISNLNKTSNSKSKQSQNNNKIKQISILDMGTGSGIQAKTCKELGFNNIFTADINQDSVKLLKSHGFRSIKSNLFSNINKRQKFNIIIFNPPYLPDDKLESKSSKIATTAGKQGYEIIIEFLKQAKTHLNKNGIILLLFSSLSKPNIIKNKSKIMGYNFKLLNKQKLFFEELFVYRFILI